MSKILNFLILVLRRFGVVLIRLGEAIASTGGYVVSLSEWAYCRRMDKLRKQR